MADRYGPHSRSRRIRSYFFEPLPPIVDFRIGHILEEAIGLAFWSARLMNDPAIQNVLAAQQGALYAQIQATLAARQISAARQQGAMIIELLNSAAANASSPQPGKAPGLGANFDAVG